MNAYQRNCPKCGKVLTTNNKYYNKKAIKAKTLCLSCVNTGRIITDAWRENMRRNHANVNGKNNPFFGKHHTPDAIEKIKIANTGKDYFSINYKACLSKKMTGCGNPFFGKHHTAATIVKLSIPKTDKHKRKLAIALKGNISPLKGKHHTPEAKRKMRIAAIKRIQELKFVGSVMAPNINPKEILFFNKLEKERGWDGIYYGKNNKKEQYLINYLGYFVDYYDPVHNIVVEYDETNHYNADWSLKKKDVYRQEEIISYLKCKFFRYNEVLDELCEIA